jgi:hypothetical protein
MSQVSKGPRRFVYAAASYLGYDVPEQRLPKTASLEEKRRAYRGIRTFHCAIVEGRAPQADGREGRFLWWYQSTLDAWITRSAEKQSKRGRKPKAEVSDASAA